MRMGSIRKNLPLESFCFASRPKFTAKPWLSHKQPTRASISGRPKFCGELWEQTVNGAASSVECNADEENYDREHDNTNKYVHYYIPCQNLR